MTKILADNYIDDNFVNNNAVIKSIYFLNSPLMLKCWQTSPSRGINRKKNNGGEGTNLALKTTLRVKLRMIMSDYYQLISRDFNEAWIYR